MELGRSSTHIATCAGFIYHHRNSRTAGEVVHEERTAGDEQQNKGQYQVLLKEVMGSFIIY